jgi:hypothetical protein
MRRAIEMAAGIDATATATETGAEPDEGSADAGRPPIERAETRA